MNTPFKKRENPLDSKIQVVEKPVTPKFDANDRIKYTATMDKALRIRIKVASAQKGFTVSEFIEEAVNEKLEREGL